MFITEKMDYYNYTANDYSEYEYEHAPDFGRVVPQIVLMTLGIVLNSIVAGVILVSKHLRRDATYWILLSMCIGAAFNGVMVLLELIGDLSPGFKSPALCKTALVIFSILKDIYDWSLMALVIQHICILKAKLRDVKVPTSTKYTLIALVAIYLFCIAEVMVFGFGISGGISTSEGYCFFSPGATVHIIQFVLIKYLPLIVLLICEITLVVMWCRAKDKAAFKPITLPVIILAAICLALYLPYHFMFITRFHHFIAMIIFFYSIDITVPLVFLCYGEVNRAMLKKCKKSSDEEATHLLMN